MSKILVKTVGKLPESWQREAVSTYAERLRQTWSVDIVEIKEGHKGASKPDLAKTQQTEAADLLADLPRNAWIVALDEQGTSLTSTGFADLVRTQIADGKTPVFLIGGSWGFADAVRDRADVTLSFGKMTLPHGLARVVLLEQLYRAAMISSGRAYHK